MNLRAQLEESIILLNCFKEILIWKNDLVYQQTLILTFTWQYFEEMSKFYQKMSTDGARTFKCIGLG